jgi:putative endonuclease
MSSNKHRTLTGINGEKFAEDYLISNGFIILERNYRYKRSEIDLIAQVENTLVFLEVKARTSQKFGLPEEAVNLKKMNKIKEGAEEFIHQINWEGNVRFDVIAIHLGNEIDLKHFIDIAV